MLELQQIRGIECMPRRRTKLDFEPLSLGETAKRLGIPRARARRILAMFGLESEGLNAGGLRTKRKGGTGKKSSRGTKALVR
jgi:hypothetical protein